MTNFTVFVMHYLMQINGTLQTIPRTIVYHRTPMFFSKQFMGKFVDELIL